MKVNSRLNKYIGAALEEMDSIPADRKKLLDELAVYVKERADKKQPARITYICTHNSRRSHLSQVWSQTAAEYFGVKDVFTYSGGTESTAFNPRAVEALARAGFETEKLSDDANPVYLVSMGSGRPRMECFSKVYNSAPNPAEGFCAVMTCDHADANCPFVSGCDKRIAITYIDPKEQDGTADEPEAYDECCRRICREQLYVFSQVDRLLCH